MSDYKITSAIKKIIKLTDKKNSLGYKYLLPKKRVVVKLVCSIFYYEIL